MKQLTPLQTCFFALLTLLSSSICLDAAVTRRDSWIALLLLAALIPLLCWLYRCLAADGGPLETLRQACGVYLGTALALGYSVLGLALAAKNFRDFSQFVTFAGLAHSEDWLDGLMLALIVLAILTLNIEALGRLSRLTIPLAMLVFGVGIAILIREAEPARLLPLMYGTKGTLKEYFFTAATLIPTPLFFLALAGGSNQGRKRLGGMLGLGGGLGALLLSLDSASSVMVLGGWLVERMRYPNYAAMSVMELGKSFQHAELLISAWLVLCLPFRVAIYLQFAKQTLQALWPGKAAWYPLLLTVLCYGAYLLLPEGFLPGSSPGVQLLFLALLVVLPGILAAVKGLRPKRGEPTAPK